MEVYNSYLYPPVDYAASADAYGVLPRASVNPLPPGAAADDRTDFQHESEASRKSPVVHWNRPMSESYLISIAIEESGPGGC